MKEGFEFESYYSVQPAILPESPLPLSSQRLHAAFEYYNTDFNKGNWEESKTGTMLKQLNVSIWSNDQCSNIREHGNPTDNTLMCIEDVCNDGNALCDLCKVKFSIITSISKSPNLIVNSCF